jgi:hypothetical protein
MLSNPAPSMEGRSAVCIRQLFVVSLCCILWAHPNVAWMPQKAHKSPDTPHLLLRSATLRVLEHPELLLGNDHRRDRRAMESFRRELVESNAGGNSTGAASSTLSNSLLDQLASPPIQVMITLSAAAMLQPDTYDKLNSAAEAMDSSILGYLPEDSYLLLCPNKTAAKRIQAALPSIVWVGVYDPSHKLAPEWVQISQ